MLDLSDYFSNSEMTSFKNEVAKQEARIAAKPWRDHSTEYGIGANTFRAFVGFKEKNPPSKTYRAWAAVTCSNLSKETLEPLLASRGSFEAWHQEMGSSLQRHWKDVCESELSYAHKNKVIDLFVKWLSQHDFGAGAVRNGFLQYGHCALDKQTLIGLNKALSGALPMPLPSMGHVQDEICYRFCQEAIDQFARACGGTPLLFDFYSWKPGAGA